MPRKKAIVDKVDKIKTKTLFDHLNEIRVGKNPKYFETLGDADKKTWSNYMVCRFLSMQYELIEVINDLQAYQDKLTPEQFYRLCIEVVPRGRGFYPYIKNKAEKYNKDLLKLLCEHFQESERNVLEYLNMLSTEEVRQIISLYGHSEKETESLLEK